MLSTKARQDDLDLKANQSDLDLKANQTDLEDLETLVDTKVDQTDFNSLVNGIHNYGVLFQAILDSENNSKIPLNNEPTTVTYTDVTIADFNTNLSVDSTLINCAVSGYYRVSVKLCTLYGNTIDNRIEIKYYVDEVEVNSSFPYFTSNIHTSSIQVDEIITLQTLSTLKITLSTTMTNFNLTKFDGVPPVTVTLVKLKDLPV